MTQLSAVHVLTTLLTAPMQGREDLARVEAQLRIEGALDVVLHLQILRPELVGHQIPLLQADPVLTGQHAPGIDAQTQDIGAKCFGAVQLPWPVGVIEDQRVQVAVAGMEHVGDPQLVVIRKPPDRLQHADQRAARNAALRPSQNARRSASSRDARL